MSGVERMLWRRLPGQPHWIISQPTTLALTVIAEIGLILAIAILSGIGYHLAAYGEIGQVRTFAAVGTLAALLYVMPFWSRDDQKVDAFLDGRRNFGRVLLRWHAALLLLGVVGFLTKTTAMFSRGWMMLFYAFGIAGLAVANAVAIKLVRRFTAEGHIASRRLMLVGTASDIAAFWARRGDKQVGERFVSVARLPAATTDGASVGDAALTEALDNAVTHARLFNVESVLILSGGLTRQMIASATETLSLLPVSIHLDAGPALDNVRTTEINRIGNVAALTLAREPLGPVAAFAKRAFDIAAALTGLILLAPLFLVVAILIKLDSKGPVLFFQSRRGYNHRIFKIVKFRSMTTLDDGDHVEQAKVGDVRITRIGAVLRKLNIDELPQLWNVLVGEMSIVGPRPHAVAHDKQFEKRIDLYPRRLNVKPGITGWAQVNGLRGETDTDDKMARRVEHDLYYIDHWSLWLDLYIIALTVLSRRAFANAR